MRHAKTKEKNIKYSRFWCLKASLVCPLDFLGSPDCENCRWHNDCKVCARKNTGICNDCDNREEEWP